MDIGVYLRIPTGYHIENQDGEDISDQYSLKLLKNCYGTKDAAANWFSVLQNGLETRRFVPSKIDPCLFTRNDCIIITYVSDCLIFRQKHESFRRSNRITKRRIQPN